jgi:serpin B
MNHRPIRLVGRSLVCALLLPVVAPLLAQSAPATAGTATAVASAGNALACDLYRQFAPAPGENVFFSPCSIETALAMTWAGARGNTAAQMAKVLHLDGLVAAQVAPAFGVWQKAVTSAGQKSGGQLALANSLWLQPDHPLRPEYLKTIRDDFAAAIFPVDYKTSAEAARLRINAWVEEQTQKRILNLLHPGDVPASTRLILVNAIYFKGAWAEKFAAQKSETAPFALASGAAPPVILMHNKMKEARYAEVADASGPLQILALPYQGGALEFVALLPKTASALSTMEKNLTAGQIDAWLGQLSTRDEVEVYLPKFKLNSRYNLVPPLQKLGLADAFTDQADFSGMDGARDLFVGNVVHQAFIEVNEEGAEAAAATGVTMRALAVRADSVPVFRADHPFLFLIRDPASGALLFLGRFATPTE